MALVLLLPALEHTLQHMEEDEKSSKRDENGLDDGERTSEHQSRQVRIEEAEGEEAAGERPQSSDRTTEEKINPCAHVRAPKMRGFNPIYIIH